MPYGNYGNYSRKRHYQFGGRNAFRNTSFKRPRMAYDQRGFFRRGGLYGGSQSSIPQRFVKGADKPEQKYFDYAFTDNASNAYVNQNFTLIPQGVGPHERVGYKCCWKSILFRMRLVLTQREDQVLAIAGVGNTVRVIVYMDKQTNGAPALASDILETSSSVRSPMRLENSHRFRVLKDWIVDMPRQTLQTGTTSDYSTSEVIKSLQFYKKLNIPQQYDGVSGAIATVRDYSIGVCIVPISGEQINFHWYSRVRFTDS